VPRAEAKTRATLGPKGEDLNEWLAVNTVDFFNEISLLYGTITEFCTPATCPTMSAGSKYEYLWADGVKVKRPIKVSAPEYIDLLMSWVESQLNNEQMLRFLIFSSPFSRSFPLQLGTPFPKNFLSIVKTIFKRLFRVYGHIYHSHFQKIVGLGAEGAPFFLCVCSFFVKFTVVHFVSYFVLRSSFEHLLQTLHFLRERILVD
jgi:MOB kinase activator 1